MAKETRKFAATSNMVRVFIPDSSSTTGAGLTGVLYTSTGLVINLIADNSNTAYHYQSAATATIQDITTLGTYAAPSASNCRFKAVDATNFPGLYEIQFLDGVFDDASCKRLIGSVFGVTNMAPTFFEIELVAYDPQDTVRLGLTALPNAAAEAAGGLYTRGTGAGQINQPANGMVDGNLVRILGTAPTEGAAGRVAAAFTKFFDKASPTGTINSIPDAVAGANGGLPTVDASNRVAGIQGATKHTLDDLNDLSGTSMASAIWNALTSGLSTVGSIGKLLVDRIDAAITSRMETFTLPTNFSALLINASGHVSRVTLADTVTTLTGHTAQSGDSFAVVSSVTFGNSALKTLIDALDDYVDTEVAAIKAKTDLIVDLTATRAEPGQVAPNATIDPLTKLDFLYKAWRNKKEKTATASKLYNSTGAVVDQKTTDSDDGTTGTRGVQSAGP